MSSSSRVFVLGAQSTLVLSQLAAAGGPQPAATHPVEPVVAVWYRGSPAGEPRQDDLAVIRALGFAGVAWPLAEVAGSTSLRRMAADVDLTVVLRPEPARLSAETALTPAPAVDVVIGKTPPGQISALAWRALAHGARVICFDAGRPSGAGLSEPNGTAPPWLRSAQAFARQISSNARLVAAARPGPPVIIERPTAPELDVVLLDGDRAWLVIATNTSARTIGAIIRLPQSVPYAIWVSLIDGSDLAMLNQPAGALWRLDLEAGGVRAYVIDKTLK